MPWTDMTKPGSGTATKKSLIDLIIDNLDYLHSIVPSSSSIGYKIPNGSLEDDTDGDLVPERWVFDAASGFVGELDGTTSADGSFSFKITAPVGDDTGGTLESADHIPIPESGTLWLKWWVKASSSTLRYAVFIDYYDADKAYMTGDTEELIDLASGVPTDWSLFARKLSSVPSTARYIKIRMVAAYQDTDGGDTWFDAIDFFNPVPIQTVSYTNAGTYTPSQWIVGAQVFMANAGNTKTFDTITGNTQGGVCQWHDLVGATGYSYDVSGGALLQLTTFGARK